MQAHIRRVAIRVLTLHLLFTAYLTAAAPQTIQLVGFTNNIGRYEKIEFMVEGAGTYTNAFDPDEARVDLELTSPSGKRLTIPAFWGQDYERRLVRQRDWLYPKGMPGWQARFAPAEIGAYKAVAQITDRHGKRSSEAISFECVPSTNKGYVRVSRKDPRFLEFDAGQPFFPIGQNLAFIGSQQYVTLSKAKEIFSKLATNGANYLRIWTCCEDWAMAIEARKSAWGRSWDWRPPFAPTPGQQNTNLRCLKLSRNRTTLQVNPSHPVALRPGTRYEVLGKVLTDAGSSLRIEVHRTQSPAITSKPNPQWSDFRHQFETGPNDYWLDRMSLRLEGDGGVYVNDLSLKEAQGGPELLWEAPVNRPIRGYYNPLDSFMLDEVVRSAEENGIYLQLCLLTRDLYMSALKNPSNPEYAQAIADAKKFFRYAVARWSYSTSVAAWEYWNEMDPGRPTDAFYTALGEHLEQIDVYHHLRTTSTWGPSAKDCTHPKLDFADTHFYLRPADKGRLRDEVDAALERTRWLRQQAPNKPVHLGEFGLANDKWQPTDEMKQSRELVDFHNSLWASGLSGATGTGLFWWWDRLDPRNVYPMYRPFSTFVSDVPWNSGEIQTTSATATDPRLRIVGLQAAKRAWLWIFDQNASWAKIVIDKQSPAPVEKAEIELKPWPNGSCRVQWFDTKEGKFIKEQIAIANNGNLRLTAPSFTRDLACKIARE